jgi:multidrug efflux system membrane fusion protein
LKPGQFVNARMQSLLLHDVVTVPTGAVQEGTAGPWVFAVGPNDTLEQRSITVTRIAGGLAVIGAGLSAGEVVVSGGQYGLTPGQKVSVAPGPQASAGGINANAVTAH